MIEEGTFTSLIEMDLTTVVVAAIAQTIFIIAWGMTPWWISTTGRAFYFKSVTLALWLDTSLVSYYFDWPHEDLTKIIIYRTLTIGIVLQLVAFFWKRRQIKQELSLHSYQGNGSVP
jgi:hypothetical protein